MKGTGKGAQEWKRDNEGPSTQLGEDEQLVDVSLAQASSSTSMTKDPTSTTNVAPGRIGRQRSFLKKSLSEETQGGNKSPRGEHGNLLKGVGTPKFVLEIQGEALEQSMHMQTLVRPHLKKSLLDHNHEESQGHNKSPREYGHVLKVVNFSKSASESHKETSEQTTRLTIVRRPTGWPYNRRVELKEDTNLDTKVDEDEKEPTTCIDTTSSSTFSSPSSPSSPVESPLQRVIIHKVDHEFYERNPGSERSLSPLFSTPRQTFDNFPPNFDHCLHSNDLLDKCSPCNASSDNCPTSTDSCPPSSASSDHCPQSVESCPPSNDSSDHCPHSHEHEEDVHEDLVKSNILFTMDHHSILSKEKNDQNLGRKPSINAGESKGLLAQSTSPTTSTSSTRSTLSSKSLDSNEALNAMPNLVIYEAPAINDDHLKAQPGEAGPAGVKIPGPSYKMPTKCLMRSPGVPYHRRRSSSSIPSQESDLLKKWTRKRLEDMEESRMKSKEDQKKVLEEAQRSRDAFYEERRAEIDIRRANNRRQEQQKMEESQNPILSTNMNQWEIVVSLINLERPTGPPAEKDDKKRLLGTPSQLQPGPPKVVPKVLIKASSKKSNMKRDKNQVTNLAASEETSEEPNKPLLKNTDLSRMKEILLKLKNNPHGGGM